jgi:hypothetical protein
VRKHPQKLEAVYAAMPPGSSLEAHMARFKEVYQADWQNIVRRCQEPERQTPQGQHHSMPEPTQYLLNMMKKYYHRTNKVVARSKREAHSEAMPEHPQPEVMPEHLQPEAMPEHLQPEAMPEHLQPEAMPEHPQPEAHSEVMPEHPQPTA